MTKAIPPRVEKPAVIELRDVGKQFGPYWVLSHLNLTVRSGETVALFGRNGSGKSTLLKILATLLAPTCGSCRWFGLGESPLGGSPLMGQETQEIRRRLRLLGHRKQLYGSLTVLENLRLVAEIRGEPHCGKPRSSCETALKRLALLSVADRRVSELSEGMKKRVVLARLLLGIDTAELILLDEPHPTLDLEGRDILAELLAQWRQEGKTLLMASHDHEQILSHVDRLLVLEQRKIYYDGPPKRLAEIVPLARSGA